MITAEELAVHRADAYERMREASRATIRRKTGSATLVNGYKVPGWSITHINIPCRLAGSRGVAGSRSMTVGAVTTEVATRALSLPHDLTNLRDDDWVELIAGENVGLVLRIIEASWQDQATARRVPVVQEQRPAEW